MADLRADEYADVLDRVERWLGTDLARDAAVFGWGGKSIGLPSSRGTWVRVTSRPLESINERVWTGEDCAAALVGVRKPTLLASCSWRDEARSLYWRADELTLAQGRVLGATPELRANVDLADAWWDELRRSLDALAPARTVRVGVRQDLVTRRVGALAPGVDATVDEWTTGHADLHWANLIAPSLVILDWEGWGRVPRGLDAATLWAFSLLVPPIADRVLAEFAADLESRSGVIARLFMCAELIKMADDYGDHPDLRDPLAESARQLVTQLAPPPRA